MKLFFQIMILSVVSILTTTGFALPEMTLNLWETLSPEDERTSTVFFKKPVIGIESSLRSLIFYFDGTYLEPTHTKVPLGSDPTHATYPLFETPLRSVHVTLPQSQLDEQANVIKAIELSDRVEIDTSSLRFFTTAHTTNFPELATPVIYHSLALTTVGLDGESTALRVFDLFKIMDDSNQPSADVSLKGYKDHEHESCPERVVSASIRSLQLGLGKASNIWVFIGLAVSVDERSLPHNSHLTLELANRADAAYLYMAFMNPSKRITLEGMSFSDRNANIHADISQPGNPGVVSITDKADQNFEHILRAPPAQATAENQETPAQERPTETEEENR